MIDLLLSVICFCNSVAIIMMALGPKKPKKDFLDLNYSKGSILAEKERYLQERPARLGLDMVTNYYNKKK